jgi:hypothetical protein
VPTKLPEPLPEADNAASMRLSIKRIRTGPEPNLLRPPASRFPTYRVVDLANWLEERHQVEGVVSAANHFALGGNCVGYHGLPTQQRGRLILQVGSVWRHRASRVCSYTCISHDSCAAGLHRALRVRAAATLNRECYRTIWSRLIRVSVVGSLYQRECGEADSRTHLG